MTYVNVGETTVYYEAKGQGTPILFIHPPGMGMVTFKKQEALADNFQIITFDMRGHGKSGYIKGKRVAIETISHDIRCILDDLGVEKAIICGYSNGGSCALDFALNYPDRVQGIVLLGGFPEVNSFLLREEFKLGIFAAKKNLMNVLGKVLAISHTRLFEKEYRQELYEYVLQTNPQILTDLYSEGLEYNCSDQLDEIEAPILLLYGKKDDYVHHYKNIFLKKHANVQIAFIDKARHQLPTKHDKEVNNLIQRFSYTI